MDPFTLEIIKNALVAAGDEMFTTLQRTAQSSLIFEVLDFAVGATEFDEKERVFFVYIVVQGTPSTNKIAPGTFLRAELAGRDRPGNEEDRLDVEEDEQHRHQVEVDREPQARVALRRAAARGADRL